MSESWTLLGENREAFKAEEVPDRGPVSGGSQQSG